MSNRFTDIYYMMQLIRKFEEKALSLFEANKLRGSVHLCIGQEAIPASVCSLLREDDYIASTHRGHGHCLAKGADPSKAMAELMGKATGYCKGRGGSMHIADIASGNLGANAIVAGGIGIAVGAALASKLQENGRVAISFFGDGATNEGVFHESLNLAAVWKLPVVFICENNGYGISVPTSQSTAVEDISVRASSYNMEGITVDGNDVIAVLDAAEKAISKARNGGGPSLIECKTYRIMGHWTGDPQTYRTKEEVERWKSRCPIKRFERYLTDRGMPSEKLKKLEQRAIEEIEKASYFAEQSPEPNPANVMDDVFYEEGISI
jgi:pyruvate dehydrogenase E1 component alpha subunit